MNEELLRALAPRPRKTNLNTEARLEAALAEARLLRREMRQLKRTLGRALEVRDVLASAAKTMTPPPRWRARSRKSRPVVEMLVLFGDLHIGERIDPKETEDWGRYNYAIAERRTARYLGCLTRWADVLRAGYRIDRCTVVCLGDMISGDIHEELRRTNEFPPPVQAVAAGRLLAALVSGLAGRFRSVRVYGVSGSNHSRLSKRYQFKGGTLNSFDFVAYEHARALLTAHRNVQLRILPAKKHTVRIAGFWFLCGHGDHVRAWMGISWYGIERDLGREAKRRLERLMEQLRRELPVEGMMDYGLGAHWHTPFVGPSFKYLVNGSLSGTNEYDHSSGRHAPPQQVAALISPKHGLFGPISWRLDTPEEADLLGVDSSGLWAGEEKTHE